MSTDVQDLLTRHKRLKEKRAQWEDLWQQIAEIMLPWRADFTTTPSPGSKRTEDLYDNTPMRARRGLATTLNGLITPRTQTWVEVEAEDPGLNEDDEAKFWLKDASERLWTAMYDRRAGFASAKGEQDNDLVTFGTGVLFTAEGGKLDRLMYRSLHLKNVVIAEDADGVIDTVFVADRLTARQAAQRFGEENLGDATQDALGNTEQDKEFDFLWVVMPRAERDPRRRDARNMPWASIKIDVASEHMIEESGFHEWPFSIQRWDTASGELYGRSPAMLALPDSQTLQQMARTILIAGQRAADPAVAVASDSTLSPVRTFPGGVTHFDLDVTKSVGRLPFQVLDTTGNLPIGRDMQLDTREQIERSFFKNVFNLPVQGLAMTATEILERKAEFLREIGPTLSQLEDDGPAVIVERSFNILLRAGAFRPIPESLQGRDVRFKFKSPVEQARKQIEAAGMARGFELMAPILQAQPETLDNFDGDQMVRDAPDFTGMPSRWIKPKAQVEEMRQSRAQAQQAAQNTADIEMGTQVIEKLANLPGVAEKLGAVTGGKAGG